MKAITPTVNQAIEACIECENSPVYNDPKCVCGQSVIRICRNTRFHLQKTIHRQDVIDYYATSVRLNFDHCPEAVIHAINNLGEDDVGIYSLAGELIDGPRDYMTMDRVKETIRANITAHVKDLNKIAAID